MAPFAGRDEGEAPSIAWKDMASAGNIYRYDYEDVAAQHVWDAVQIDLPPLRVVIERELAARLTNTGRAFPFRGQRTDQHPNPRGPDLVQSIRTGQHARLRVFQLGVALCACADRLTTE